MLQLKKWSSEYCQKEIRLGRKKPFQIQSRFFQLRRKMKNNLRDQLFQGGILNM